MRLASQGGTGDLELSPDGRKAIVSVLDPETNTRDLWMFDVARGVRTRFTFDPADDVAPIWSPDGTRVAFTSNRKGHFDLYQKAASGIGMETVLFADDKEKYPTSWLPNGGSLLYWTFDSAGTKILQVSASAAEAPTIVVEASVGQASLSPNGRWLAYYSAESGRSEVYVVPFPSASRRWQVSSAGGTLPRWTHDGREILFAGRDNRLMAVTVQKERDELELGVPRALFEARAVSPRSFYAVSPDGQRDPRQHFAKRQRSLVDHGRSRLDRCVGAVTTVPPPRLAVHDALGRRVVLLDKPLFTIGRQAGHDLQLAGAEVSRDHAEIALMPQGAVIRDRGSRYGTFVNGEQVDERLLADGDRIECGRTGAALVFLTGETSLD